MSTLSMLSAGATRAANTGLGMLLQGWANRSQAKQHLKLGEQQLGLDRKKMDYQNQKALEMWQATNYPAQLAQMKKAGLSPGLMYGLSGAGGQTTAGGSSGGNVNGPAPPTDTQNIMGMQLIRAQERLLNAQAQKAEAEAAKTAGPDTTLTTKQAAIAELERSMLHDTYEETYYKITAEADKAHFDAAIAGQTVDTEIKMRQAELLGIGLTNELKNEGIKLTKAQTKETISKIAQKWMDLKLKEGKLNLDKFINDVAMSTRLTVETAAKVVNTLVKKK